MKAILTYGLMGVALIANSNGVIPFETTVIQSKESCETEGHKMDDEKIDGMMMERMQQICKVLDVDSSSLTKEQMAILLNKVEEL